MSIKPTARGITVSITIPHFILTALAALPCLFGIAFLLFLEGV